MSAPEVAGRRVGPAADIPPGEARTFAVGSTQVAVFRLRTGELRALDAVCPHSGGPLADGQIDAAKVVCPLHLYAFSFADGSCLNGDNPPVRTYPVREQDGEIVVDA